MLFAFNISMIHRILQFTWNITLCCGLNRFWNRGSLHMTYGFSHGYSIRSGFPHSDIYGSKLVCQLPVAFRRLPRPSSPVIAKASTTCTCSLDPITGVSRAAPTGDEALLTIATGWVFVLRRIPRAIFRSLFSYIDTITTLIHLLTHPSLSMLSWISLLLLPDC